MMGKGGSSFNVSSNDLGISLTRNNRAKEIESEFGAANLIASSVMITSKDCHPRSTKSPWYK
jgi:hypothetical protein